MTENELGNKLKELYNDVENTRDKTVRLTLFGIEFAEEINNNKLNINEILKIAGIPNYNATINNGIKLSRYVKLK